MAYIRRKRFRDREFLYWVRGVSKDGVTRQEVLAYLGPADDPDVVARAQRLEAEHRKQRRVRSVGWKAEAGIRHKLGTGRPAPTEGVGDEQRAA